MRKECWFVRLGQEGVAWRKGEGTVWNTLKGGATEKKGGTDFKKLGKLGQGAGVLKREREAGTLSWAMWP